MVLSISLKKLVVFSASNKSILRVDYPVLMNLGKDSYGCYDAQCEGTVPVPLCFWTAECHRPFHVPVQTNRKVTTIKTIQIKAKA